MPQGQERDHLSLAIVLGVVTGLAVFNLVPAFLLIVPAVCGADVPPVGWVETFCDAKPITLSLCALGPTATLLVGLGERRDSFAVVAAGSLLYSLALTAIVFLAD